MAANFWFSEAAISAAERPEVVTVLPSREKSDNPANAIPAVRAVHEAVDRESRERHGVRDARLREQDPIHLVNHFLGAVERRRLGQLRVRDEVLLVLLRDEARGHAREAEPGQEQQPAVNRDREPRAAQQAARDADVAQRRPLEQAIERA